MRFAKITFRTADRNHCATYEWRSPSGHMYVITEWSHSPERWTIRADRGTEAPDPSVFERRGMATCRATLPLARRWLAENADRL